MIPPIPWRLVGAVAAVAVVAAMGWRVSVWREGWQAREAAEEALAAEVECRPKSKCGERAEEAKAKAERMAKESEARYEKELDEVRNRPPVVRYVRVCNKGRVSNADAAGSPDGGTAASGRVPEETGRDFATDDLYTLAKQADALSARLRELQGWNRAMAQED